MLFDPFEWLKWPIKYLKFVGIWVEKDAKLWRKVLAGCIRFHMIQLFFLHQVIHLVRMNDFEEITEVIKLLCTLIGYAFKSSNLIRKRDEIARLDKFAREIMEQDSWLVKSGGSKLKQQLQTVKRMYQFNGMLGFFAIISILAIPFQTHHLYNKFYFPFDHERNEIVFWSTVAYQSIGYAFTVPATIIVDMIPVVYMAMATGFIEELNDCLCDLTNVDADERLIEFIKIHLKIKDFVLRTQHIFSPMIMLQGLMTTCILCSTYFMVTKVRVGNQ